MSESKSISPHKHNGADFPSYEMPSDNDLKVMLSEFHYLFEMFCERMDLSLSDISVDEKLVIKALIRLDQRRLHYKMYHNGTIINELKEVAILCYWLIKYKPIIILEDGVYTTSKINEVFALFLILSTIVEYRFTQGLPEAVIQADMIQHIMYTLRNRASTFDSMVILVDALADR